MLSGSRLLRTTKWAELLVTSQWVVEFLQWHSGREKFVVMDEFMEYLIQCISFDVLVECFEIFQVSNPNTNKCTKAYIH